MTASPVLDVLEEIIVSVVDPAAACASVAMAPTVDALRGMP